MQRDDTGDYGDTGNEAGAQASKRFLTGHACVHSTLRHLDRHLALLRQRHVKPSEAQSRMRVASGALTILMFMIATI